MGEYKGKTFRGAPYIHVQAHLNNPLSLFCIKRKETLCSTLVHIDSMFSRCYLDFLAPAKLIKVKASDTETGNIFIHIVFSFSVSFFIQNYVIYLMVVLYMRTTAIQMTNLRRRQRRRTYRNQKTFEPLKMSSIHTRIVGEQVERSTFVL